MVVAEAKNLRTRLDEDKKDRLLALCKRKRISLQDAIEAMVDFLFDLDDTTQSLVLGQISNERDKSLIAKAVLKRIAEPDHPSVPRDIGPPMPASRRSKTAAN